MQEIMTHPKGMLIMQPYFVAAVAGAASTPWPDGNAQRYSPPIDQSISAFVDWFTNLEAWRTEQASMLNLSAYQNKALQWAFTSFVQPQVMIHEKFLYSRDSNQWTVGRLIDDLTTRYGGIDSVLLWPTYPNIGVDSRNQYDMHRSPSFHGPSDDLAAGSERLPLERARHNCVEVRCPLSTLEASIFRAALYMLPPLAAVRFIGDRPTHHCRGTSFPQPSTCSTRCWARRTRSGTTLTC